MNIRIFAGVLILEIIALVKEESVWNKKFHIAGSWLY